MNSIGRILLKKTFLSLLRGDGHRLATLLNLFGNLSTRSGIKLLANLLLTERTHPFFKVIERFQTEINPVSREKIFKNLFWKSKNNGKNGTPPTIFISVTSKCNLLCKGCSAHKQNPVNLDMVLIDWIISDAKNNGTRLFVFTGGEPFLRNELLPLMEKHSDTYFQIFTNGTLIDNGIAESLSRNGNAIVLFSLEGFSDYTDFRRGKDVFHKVTRSMSLLKEKGVLFGTSILVTPDNFNVVTSREFIEELIKRGVFFAWYLTYKPVGDKLDLSLLFPPHQRYLLSKKVVEIRNLFPIIAIDHENDVAPIGGCLATNGIGIHINAKGGIEPCGILHYYDTYVKYGETIEDSIKQSRLLNEMKSFNSSSVSCPLIDRPLELSETIKKTFPKTYSDLTDFKFLQEYIREYTKTPGHQEKISTVTKKDLYTHIAEYILKSACPS
jgi:MoaA/NifB/PqqE/SkfB family radical SAM enzyme